MARKKKTDSFIEEVVTNVEAEVEAPAAEEAPSEVDVSVEETSVTEEKPAEVKAPIQVKKDKVIFVPFVDFEGRINERTFNFKKNVAVECTVDEAHTWVDAEKGYIK